MKVSDENHGGGGPSEGPKGDGPTKILKGLVR